MKPLVEMTHKEINRRIDVIDKTIGDPFAGGLPLESPQRLELKGEAQAMMAELLRRNGQSVPGPVAKEHVKGKPMNFTPANVVKEQAMPQQEAQMWSFPSQGITWEIGNIKAVIQDNKLCLEVNLSHVLYDSKSGRAEIIAESGNFAYLPGRRDCWLMLRVGRNKCRGVQQHG